jgi:hypothetical protein
LILVGEESFETNFIVYFVFVMVDCIFVSECRVSTYRS